MGIMHLNLKIDKSTEVMDQFLKGDNGKPYDKLFLSGFLPKQLSRSASLVFEPCKYDNNRDFISISEFKRDWHTKYPFVEEYYWKLCYKGVTNVYEHIFDDNMQIYIKCQSSSDRSGFYKEYWGDEIISEKNYGECSCYFKCVKLIVYPELW